MAEKCDIQTPEYIVLPSEGGGVPGPQGPAGPVGPPGIGSLPVPAADVSVAGHLPYTNAQEIFDKLLYVLIEILTFTSSKDVYEMGQEAATLGFYWSLNKALEAHPDVYVRITGAHVESGTDLPRFATFAAATFSPPLGKGALIPFNSVFTMSVYDRVNIATKTLSLHFYSGIYWGDTEEPAIINSDFLNNILTKKLQSGRGTTFMSNAFPPTPDKKIYTWYANRTPLGQADFNAGGFDGGFQAPITISFTNDFGFTEQYYVYRSENPNIGSVKIIAT